MTARRIAIGEYVIGDKEKEVVADILNSGRITEGKYVSMFEREFARIIGTEYCTLTNSGTSALMAGLTALLYDERYPKIKHGAKVITTPLTYIATSNAIKLTGLEPVYVDVNLDTYGINVDMLRETLRKGGADEYCMILPVHLMGYPCDMDKINELAYDYDLVVFEDSAQAHGSKYNGCMTGTLSLLSAFSFYPAHNIQCGEMGCVVTNDAQINTAIKRIKANGRLCSCKTCVRSEGKCPYKGGADPRFNHITYGYNFKTTEFSAGLGLVQLGRFDDIIKKRRNNVKYLNNGLSVPRIREYLTLPTLYDDVSYLGYPLVANQDKLERSSFTVSLRDRGIENRPLYGCIPTQQLAYSNYKDEYEFVLPNAEYLGRNGLYIGCHQYLTNDDLDYMIAAIQDILS
jgi:CDP-6-deoxy-D-xylo-4-hexulose-3-dehydrase